MIIFEAGDTFAGRFRLEERVGQGGMGEVWRATQIGLNREVALKIILPNSVADTRFRQMFLQEAQLSGKLNHPNIVSVVDFGEGEGGILWLVQMFVRGLDLGGLLSRAPGGLPAPIAGYVIGEILLGLQCAHDHAVVHRDLKPSNVLVSLSGNVQITDFGIAKTVSHHQTPSFSTTLKGSPGYLAPELLRGQPPSFASDLFAVGVMFWELLAGRHPFIQGPYADREQIFMATLNEPVPSLAGVAPPAFDAVIGRLLAKDPAQRYAHAGEALDELLVAMAPMSRDATPLALRRYVGSTSSSVATRVNTQPPISTPARIPGTTGMSGQMAARSIPPVRPERRWGRMAAIAGGAVMAVGLGVAVALSASSAPEPAASAPAATPLALVPPAVVPDAASPKLGRLTLRVVPPRAHVKLNGRVLEGASPFVAEIPVGSEASVEASLEGFGTRTESFAMTGDRMLDLLLDSTLDAGPAPTPTPDAAPPPSPPASTPEKSRRPNSRQPKPHTPDIGKDEVMPI